MMALVLCPGRFNDPDPRAAISTWKELAGIAGISNSQLHVSLVTLG